MARGVIKKSIGSSVLLVLLATVVLFSTGTAQALFRYIGSDFRGAGKVTAKNATSFELTTSGSTWPFTMVVSGATSYSGGYSSFSDVNTGDEVSVVANRSSGDFTTIEVKKVPDPASYGNAPCDSFAISTALFERPVNNTFYVVKDNIGTRINYDANTQVIGGVWNDLLAGTQVEIAGFDCRSTNTLTAQTITIITNQSLTACNSFGPNAIVVRNQEVLLAHDASSAKTKMISASIPAGNYKVHGVSFDNHSTTPWDTSTREQWLAKGYNGDNLSFTSGTTDDLPNGIDYNTTTLNSNVAITGLDKVQLVHAVAPGTDGYQSIYPICVVFEPIQAVNELPEILGPRP